MAVTLTIEDREVEARDGESVLDALLRAGIDVPFSCRGGSCLTCMMQCESGKVPESAQTALTEHLRRSRYFLPCQCVPSGSMKLRRPQPDDLITPCYFCEATAGDDGSVDVILEPQRTLRYRQGQSLHIVTGSDHEPVLQITSDPDRDYVLTGRVAAPDRDKLPAALLPGAEFGFEFEVRGPFDQKPPTELPYPEPDPDLWARLDGGVLARRVLEAFYAKVYADELLAPFFSHVTKDRAIDKQFSFMKQCITGEKIYMGDRPRNAHHWMIITHELFDHRQSLMLETWAEHGVAQDLIERWTGFEEYFRPDMVKSTYWPRQVGDQLIMNDGFAEEVLGEASLCDHCQREVRQGERVLLHRRLGTISCEACASESAPSAHA